MNQASYKPETFKLEHYIITKLGDMSMSIENEIARQKKPVTDPSAAVTVAPEISAEVRDELTALMQELLMKTHELSFEYSTLDCEQLSQCPLCKKSKELFRVVKKLNELVRKMTPQPKGGYVS